MLQVDRVEPQNSKPCPRIGGLDTGTAPAASPNNPYFAFNGTFGETFECFQGQSFTADGKQWFHQRVYDLVPVGKGTALEKNVQCSVDVHRVCSIEAGHSYKVANPPGPTVDGKQCGTVGPGGCSVCNHLLPSEKRGTC